MNRVATAAAAALVIALFVIPGVVGSMTEASVKARVAAIDESPSAAAELTSFDRGWFNSTARIVLRPENVDQLAPAGAELGPFGQLPIVVEFAHGPIAVLHGVYFGWSTMVARPDVEAPGIAALTQQLNVPYLFQFRGRTPYFGGLDFDADAPPFTLPIDEGSLTFSGGTLAGKLAGRNIDADAQIGSVDFASATGTFAVRGVSVSVDNELRSEYVMPGEASFSVASISLAPPQGVAPMFETSNLRMKSDVDIDAAGELLEMQINYDVDSVLITENEVTGGSVAVLVRNLDAAAVEAYGALATDAAAAGDDPETIAAALVPHLERALRAAPSVTVDPIRFRYDDEPFVGRVEITANPARLPPAGTLSLDNPLLFMSLVNTKAELSLSKTLAGQLATLAARVQIAQTDPTIPPEQLDYMAEGQSGLMLTMLVGQGVLVEDGDLYRTSLDFSDGSMTLNGNALPFGFQ
ncbi:MAG TPA: YdgA family protein [Gammaproteobacteria bacterium]